MKKILYLLVFSLGFTGLSAYAAPQDLWPKLIRASDGTEIKLFEPQPESFQDNVLKARFAISITESGKQDPTFGTCWAVANVETDRNNRTISIITLKVANIKFPDDANADKTEMVKNALETEVPRLNLAIPLDELLASLDMRTEEKKLSKDLNNKPPKVIYASRPSILVVIDGEPKLQRNPDWGVDAVMNTPFTIIKSNDGQYYLYGNKKWFNGPSPTGPFRYTERVPNSFGAIAQSVDDAVAKNTAADNSDQNANTDQQKQVDNNVIPEVIVSTTPAELIQSNGEANFAPIENTNLLYVKNSDNDIFMQVGQQQYYVLLSGRWYTSKTLSGNWDFVPSDKLPSDFAGIQEGSPKDNVLASVAGTDAAREAVMDAQIPQTAKVDRRNATTDVTYDGDPRFEDIDGTHMQYAVNSQNSIIRYRDLYYTVDNGVWFQSNSPRGPWQVCVDRPDEIDLIPPSYPVYNTKYVYIYDVNPDYVYMGYTAGYLNTFIYGPTVVYGTGYYYNPWYGGYYYPRPCTWGYNMWYNPWAGWSIGFNFNFGWFHFGLGGHRWGYAGCGWWGPSMYRPPYIWSGYRNYGVYGRNNNYRGNNYFGGRNYINNNIYRNRSYVVSRNINRYNPNYRVGNGITRPGTNGFNRNSPINGRPSTGYNNSNNANPGGRNPNTVTRPYGPGQANNNVYSDRNGNVYQRNGSQWQQRNNRQWQPVQPTPQRQDVIRNLDRQQQLRDRGQVRSQNFDRVRSAPPSGGGSRPAPAPANRGGGNERPRGNGRRG